MDTKDIRKQIQSLSVLQAALAASLKGFEAAGKAALGSPSPAAALMLDTMLARASELSSMARSVESSVRALQKAANPAAAAD